jgi:phosphotransferase system HPr (HPr) family protein
LLQENITIVNKLGLHARAAAKLVRLASSFDSEVLLKRQQREVNGKSIMGVMLLAAGKGSEIQLSVSGKDEQLAFAKISALIKSGFGEEE